MHEAYSPPRIYQWLEAFSLEDRNPRSRALNVIGCPDCWTACCCSELDVKPYDALGAAIRQLGIADLRDPISTCTRIDQSLRSVLGKTTRDDERVKVQQIFGLGMPLHLRLLRDFLQDGNDPALSPWEDFGRPVTRAWLKQYQTTNHSLADTYWLAQHLFAAESIRSIANIQTSLVAVAESRKPGRLAHLKLSLIDWPGGSPEMEHGFVRQPFSFGYCIDEEFLAGLSNSWTYLSSLGLTEGNLAVAWNLEMDTMENTTPLLNGGSAGAAFALAGGSLLASHLRSA